MPGPGDQQFLSQIALQSSGGGHGQLWNGERVQRLPLPQSERLVFVHGNWAGYVRCWKKPLCAASTRGCGQGVHRSL